MIAIVFLLSPGLLCAFQNEPDKFRGIKWGANIKEMSDDFIFAVKGDPWTRYYRRKNDKLSIGQVYLKELIYGFYKNRFCSVIFCFEDDDDSKKFSIIKQTIITLYGNPVMECEYECSWIGMGDKLYIRTKKTSDLGSAKFEYTPISIYERDKDAEDWKNKRDKMLKDAAKEAAKDL